ncbi:hypothetical protein ACMGDM_10310 [Sphingomonas sp. DT-51]|uniref:hypothetical protein n=1 Tax=Sphingomonas sp. DT-51 TaxID=3396165 RepID=UPI003F1BE263
MTKEVSAAPVKVKLDEGTAEYMGDGMFVVDQTDEGGRGASRFQRVTLSRQDLEAMLAAA